MGFKLNLDLRSDEERWREVLARYEAEFADIKIPAVHSRDDESPGLLLLLERNIGSEYYDLAAGIIEELRSNKARWIGILASAEARRCPEWHARAKPIWMELRGRYNAPDCARKIKTRLRNDAGVPGVKQIRRAIAQWEEELATQK
jgi:hypothetical protein